MINKDLRIVFFGTPDFVIPVLETLDKHFTLVGIVTTQDQKVGRKQILTPTSVKQWAIKNNIPVVAEGELSSLHPDLFVVAAFGKIIGKKILEIPKFGAINIHPSLLPKYRGASPIQSAIFHGDKESGVSMIKMDEEMDHGKILYVKNIILSNEDTFDSLSIKMFQVAAGALPSVIEDYVREKLHPVAQDDTKATFCDHITKHHGYFDSDPPAGGLPSPEKIDRMIRAYYPWPGVWTRLRLKASDGQAKIVKLLPNKMIQVEGKNPVSYKDFINGYPHLKSVIEKIMQ